jgi:hypothetical protein
MFSDMPAVRIQLSATVMRFAASVQAIHSAENVHVAVLATVVTH